MQPGPQGQAPVPGWSPPQGWMFPVRARVQAPPGVSVLVLPPLVLGRGVVAVQPLAARAQRVAVIGVHALDLVPKNAAGTSAGLTGLFGYFLGTALLANVAAGYIIDAYSWNGFFLFMLGACALSILLLAITWKKE